MEGFGFFRDPSNMIKKFGRRAVTALGRGGGGGRGRPCASFFPCVSAVAVAAATTQIDQRAAADLYVNRGGLKFLRSFEVHFFIFCETVEVPIEGFEIFGYPSNDMKTLGRRACHFLRSRRPRHPSARFLGLSVMTVAVGRRQTLG